MPAISTSLAKNIIRRSLLELVDPSPNASTQSEIWKFFGSTCAYCGKRLHRKKKGAHLDHLVSSSASGMNHQFNRVLSCAPCNEAEKRELDWREFLQKKNSETPELFRQRLDRIETWTAKTDAVSSQMLEQRRAQASVAVAQIWALFDEKVKDLRALTQSAPSAV